MTPTTVQRSDTCHCGRNMPFSECCELLMRGKAAATAEDLMRSRYSAYVIGDFDYIAASLSSELLASFNLPAVKAMSDDLVWLGLDIRAVEGGGSEDEVGLVEFAARFKEDGREKIHHERARFSREHGRWVYAGGDMRPKGKPREVQKIGRNEPCPCGSGKKYKKCHGA